MRPSHLTNFILAPVFFFPIYLAIMGLITQHTFLVDNRFVFEVLIFFALFDGILFGIRYFMPNKKGRYTPRQQYISIGAAGVATILICYTLHAIHAVALLNQLRS